MIHNKELACPAVLLQPALPKCGNTAPLLQASSVCKNLVLATADLLGQPGTELDLFDYADEPKPSRLDSKLLSSWAPSLHQLALSEATLAVPGLATFVREAVHLETLRVIWLPPAAAAELRQLFCTGSFSSITKLVCEYGHLPMDLPSGLQHLEVDLYREWVQDLPADKLFCILSKPGLALQSLSIRLIDENVPCNAQVLPPLQDLHLQLALHGSKATLEWLRKQQTSRLHLAIKC